MWGNTKRAGTDQPGEAAGKQFCREGHGVLVDCKLTISQQCILAERCPTACWAALGGAGGRSWSSSSAKPWWETYRVPSPVLSSSIQGTRLVEQVQSRVKDMIKGLEHLSYLRRLGELGLFSLEKRTLISNYKDGTRLFSVVYKA